MATIDTTVSETLYLAEQVRTGEVQLEVKNSRTFRAVFPEELHFDNAFNPANYTLAPDPADVGVPLPIVDFKPFYDILQTGSSATPVAEDETGVTTHLEFAGFLSSFNVGDFVFLLGGQNGGLYQIDAVLDQGPAMATVQLDRPMSLFGSPSPVTWAHVSGIKGVEFIVPKITDNALYLFQASNLYLKTLRTPFSSGVLRTRTSGIEKPRLLALDIDDEGTITLTFNEDMRMDASSLLSRGDYSITGPSTVRVTEVQSLDARRVALFTSGLVGGDYTITISTSTPTDIAGNPLDPAFASAIFTALAPILNRSIFTDKGPIAKSEEVNQTGATATIDSFETLTLPGVSLTVDDVGLRLRLTGSGSNDDTYRILSVTGPETVKVSARLAYPDANSGAVTWEVVDPRNGMIADSPSDVTVRVNGVEVVPDAVVGLRGQVVLPTIPDEDDSVEVDYCWVCNPRVEIRRLNSKEFRLNSWNRDTGGNADSRHNYRFNNVLITPSNYQSNDIQSPLEEPQLRQLKYRAYERAYSALLNDPNRLLLNTPIHKIAYPPPQRTLEEVSVFYEGTSLPEVASPTWTRYGGGTASSMAGVLTVMDDSTGTFPTGEGIFWTQKIDLSFDHVLAAAWRFSLDSVTTYEGVWSGVAAGYSDTQLAFVVGYLEEAGVKKIGFLKRGAQENLEVLDSWISADFDWSVLHSYRISRDQNGAVRLFVDGDVVETLIITPGEAPALEELNAPFDKIQGAFFGSLSRPAQSESSWDFFRYLVQPLNALQTSPSSFVSYEGNVLPEVDPSPWTPVGFHGTGTIQSTDFLLLDSTSASDDSQGLVGGDFRAYLKFEPLLTASSQYTIDFDVQLLTKTHGIDPYGTFVAVDDSTRLMQVALISDTESPKLSYGGRSFPEDFSPTTWQFMGSQTASMLGRYLQVVDTSTTDGKVYFAEDTNPVGSDGRVFSSTIDYIAECRCKVNSYTVDGDGFAGAFMQVFDSTRSVGLLLQEVGGTKYVSLHAEGVVLSQFAFDWGGGAFHTYRFRKSTVGNLVSLFADGTFLGSEPYSNFATPSPDPIGILSFGSSTPASVGATSDVEWAYCNSWRVLDSERRYIGVWKGTTGSGLADYHLPIKTAGRNATAAGNAMGDTQADFITDGILTGDLLIVDSGPNKGVYEIANVTSATTLTLTAAWTLQPTIVDYRIVREQDWGLAEKYRLFRDSSGNVQLFAGTDTTPIISVGYNPIDLPVSGTGLVKTVSDGIAAIIFGSLSGTELSQSRWDYVRYGITRSPNDQRIVPLNQVLNQWNVMESPERLFTVVPHDLTDFKSSSTGITPNLDPDFLERNDVVAFTQLNQGTPLVPRTQTFEVRAPYPTQTFVSALNRPEDVLNSPGAFVLNDGSVRVTLEVPDDVLYSCLKVIETEAGTLDLLKPADDGCGPQLGSIQYQKEVCLDYTADTLPEDDATASTPWQLNSNDPNEVSTSVFGGTLTYGTSATGTRTAYINNTPLPDAPSLQTEATFRLKLESDATLGTGDSQVRFGLSAPGMTIGIGFVTTATGERFVNVFDLNSGIVLGYATFDYLDGNFHTYRIVRTPGPDRVQIFIDA